MKVLLFISEGPEEEKHMLQRIRSLLESVNKTEDLLFNYGLDEPSTEIFGLQFRPKRNSVVIDGQEHFLNKAEFDLLHLLAAFGGEIVTHEEIMQCVVRSRNGRPSTDSTSNTFIRNLRRKLGLEFDESRYTIKSNRGRGYSLIKRD